MIRTRLTAATAALALFVGVAAPQASAYTRGAAPDLIQVACLTTSVYGLDGVNIYWSKDAGKPSMVRVAWGPTGYAGPDHFFDVKIPGSRGSKGSWGIRSAEFSNGLDSSDTMYVAIYANGQFDYINDPCNDLNFSY
jgi:hypothetical protein